MIFVGGTGLYFRALTQGLSDIPAVPTKCARRCARAPSSSPSAPRCTRELAARDPATAARLRPSDRQRILRALEVFAATGRPLASFQGARGAPVLGAGEWAGLFLAPDREALNAAIERRFRAMLTRARSTRSRRSRARRSIPRCRSCARMARRI